MAKNVVQEEEMIVTEGAEATEELEEDTLFEGGPTMEQVDAWKEKHGQIYMTEVDDEDLYIWRVLSRREFKEIMKVEEADAMYREERVCEKCILWPKNYSFTSMNGGKAGVPTILAEQIMEKSGFAPKTGPIPL